MNLAEYRHWIRDAALPTDEQCERFAWHVMHAHSWYKGSLHRGTRMVLFIEPELEGEVTDGRRIRDRLWHARRYRDEYGSLAYLWGGRAGQDYDSDYCVEMVDKTVSHEARTSLYPAPDLPPQLIDECGFALYPFSYGKEFFYFADALHQTDALREIWAGRPHPHRRLLCQLREADFDGHAAFDYELDIKPVWSFLALHTWQAASLTPEMAAHPSTRPLARLVADLRWAFDQERLTARQRECARHLWNHYRRAACLEKTEQLKITRALHRLRRLVSS